MRFASPSAAARPPSVLSLAGISLLPPLVVLAMVCLTIAREEETVRLPSVTVPRPPHMAKSPLISLRISRQGGVKLAGEAILPEKLAAAWQRERAALKLIGFEPAQATVVVHADRELPTDRVQQVIQQAQEAGFTRCVLRPADEVPSP